MLNVNIKEIKLTGKDSEKIILKNIDFSLEPNKIFTILGRNGSGKSTLIKSLTKLLDERFYSVNGKIIFNDNNLLKLNADEMLNVRRDKIKYVFQDAVNSFNPLKTFEYYFDHLAKYPIEIPSLLNYFVLPEKDKLFKLYPYEVSGGMAQRISLTLALLSRPEIIILDEPTSGIDSAIANLFLLKLKDFVSEAKNSVLLVTQDIDFAQKISDKIAYLNDGKLSDFYSTKEFFEIKDDESVLAFLNTKAGFEK